MSRPPVAVERRALTAQGQVRYRLKTPYRDGTTHIVLEPLDFMARLAVGRGLGGWFGIPIRTIPCSTESITWRMKSRQEIFRDPSRDRATGGRSLSKTRTKGDPMRMSTIAPLVMAALACLTVSCQKIQEPALIEANLKFTTAQFTDAIPAAYGQLVSVTPTPDAYGAALWFRKPDESIVMVEINHARGALSPNILEIPRR